MMIRHRGMRPLLFTIVWATVGVLCTLLLAFVGVCEHNFRLREIVAYPSLSNKIGVIFDGHLAMVFQRTLDDDELAREIESGVPVRLAADLSHPGRGITSSLASNGVFGILVARRVGWPLHCLGDDVEIASTGGAPQMQHDGVIIPGCTSEMQFAVQLPNGTSEDRLVPGVRHIVLPRQVYALEFIVNSIVFAGGLAGLAGASRFGILAARASIRRRRSLCPHCGYPQANGDGQSRQKCPECGR